MNAVYGLYDDGYAAQRAVNSLRAAGLRDDEITVITSTPMEDFEFSHIGKDNWMWYIACAGALAGFLGSTALTSYTQRDWPILTGNMPIVAWWPNLIVMFEMTMLGAILATVVTLLVTGGLLRRQPALYDPAVTQGKILVGVEDPDGRRIFDVESALIQGTAVRGPIVTAPERHAVQHRRRRVVERPKGSRRS